MTLPSALRRFPLFAACLALCFAFPPAAWPAREPPVPSRKPPSHAGGGRGLSGRGAKGEAAPAENPPAELETEDGAPPRRRLGVIGEQSPLLAPDPNRLFSPPPEAAKPAPAPRDFSPPTPADYPLSAAVLTRLEKIHAEILALPDSGNDGNDADDNISGGVDILVKALEKRPDVMGVLGRNLISAREYVTAMQAAANALAAAADVSDRSGQISAANIAFGKKYAARIRALLEE